MDIPEMPPMPEIPKAPKQEFGNCGFVTILGRPNVGKSTFLNQILEYKLAAVSHVPHTTRRRWLGIYSHEDCQIIFADTPGIHESQNRMDNFMERTIVSTLNRNDFTMLICDPKRKFGEEDLLAANAAVKSEKPYILVLNKCDLANLAERKEMRENYLEVLGAETEVFEISALQNNNLDLVIAKLKATLPHGPFLYPRDQIADAFIRDIAEDIIREACLEVLREELPHSLAVLIDSWDEREKKIKIEATIYVERKTQKQIVIGAKGSMIEVIRKSAREKLGPEIGKFVDLRLFVKVMPDWQNKIGFLKELKLNDWK